MIRLMSTLPRLVRSNVRSFTGGQVRMVDRKVVEEINKRQAEFQASDEPVHMIGKNKIHFYVTTVFGFISLTGCMYGLYKLVD